MRVIAGRLRGRRLGPVPDGVRPTSDRVRESLFNLLGRVDGCTVLDAFAGSGALGLEALSRGATRVVFVERARATARSLASTLDKLGIGPPEVQLIVGDALTALARLARSGSRFDLVLLDPPYASDLLAKTLEGLVAKGLLAPGATVVAEAPKRHPLPPVVGLEAYDERHYGDTRLLFWRFPASPTAGEPEGAGGTDANRDAPAVLDGDPEE